MNYELYVLDEKMQQLGSLSGTEKNNENHTINFSDDKAYLGSVEETTTCIDLSQPEQMKEVSQISIQPELETLYEIDEGLGIQLENLMGWINSYCYGACSMRVTLWDIKGETPQKLDEIIMEGSSIVGDPFVNKAHQLLAVPALEKDSLPNEQFPHYKEHCLSLTVENNKLQEVARLEQIRTYEGIAVTTDADYIFGIGDSLYYKYDNEISEYDLETLEYKGNTILE